MARREPAGALRLLTVTWGLESGNGAVRTVAGRFQSTPREYQGPARRGGILPTSSQRAWYLTEEDRTERVIVVGDLHLDPDSARDRLPDESDAALRNLMEAIAAEPEGAARRRLVLLGDVIDFDRARHAGPAGEMTARAAEAVGRLDSTHPQFVEALRIAGSAGFTVHVVAGNHDPEWALQDVAGRLRSLIDTAGTIEFHPWILHMSGRLHAEHGNHLHDLNAMPRPSQPFAPDAPSLHLGSVIDRWSGEVAHARAGTRGGGLPGRSLGMIRVLAAHLRLAWRALVRLITLSGPAERRRRERFRRGALQHDAGAIGIRGDAAAAVDRLGQVEPLAMARRLVASLGQRGPDTRGQALMRRGARRLDALLTRFESGAPLLVLAHSHVAEITALRDGRWYANPGRWAPDLDGAYPYLEVGWNEQSATVELLAWDDATRQSARISIGQVKLAHP